MTRVTATCVLAACAFGLICAGTALPVFGRANAAGTVGISFTLWGVCKTNLVPGATNVTCTAGGLDELPCDAMRDRFKAGRAFTVLASLVAGIALVVAAARPFVESLNAELFGMSAFLILSAVAAFAALIAFPVVISVYTVALCSAEGVVAPVNLGFGIGPAAFLVAVGFGFLVAAIAVEYLFSRAGGANADAANWYLLAKA
jgi:hypothetical protein